MTLKLSFLLFLPMQQPLPIPLSEQRHDLEICSEPKITHQIIRFKICQNLASNDEDFQSGYCWAAGESPDLFDSFELISKNSESIDVSMSKLLPNTIYFFRFFRLYKDGKVEYQQMHEFQTLPELKLGMHYQGGIIIYFFKNSDSGYIKNEQHGLILSKENLGRSLWGGFGETIEGRTSAKIGTGKSNTVSIVTQLKGTRALLSSDSIFSNYIAPSAAQICEDYKNEGFTDWFLPSKEEWVCLFTNMDQINLNNFIFDKAYWTSSEFYFAWSRKKRTALETKSQYKKAWTVSMPNTSLIVSSAYKKNQVALVRAMRYF